MALYLFGSILGVLLISQFWTVANLVYDPRQAKRIFGFIGGGAALGGIAGSEILIRLTDRIGTNSMLLISGTLLIACSVIVWIIFQRSEAQPSPDAIVAGAKQKGVGVGEALVPAANVDHLQIIALVISFAAVGAAIIEQQLNMAAAASKGQEATDAITVFLAQVQRWTSISPVSSSRCG